MVYGTTPKIISKIYDNPINFEKSELDEEAVDELGIKYPSIIVNLIRLGILEEKTIKISAKGTYYGTVSHFKTRVQLEKSFWSILADINRFYDVSTEDYLLKIYLPKKEPRMPKSKEKEPVAFVEMRSIKNILSTCKLEKAGEHLNRSIESYGYIWKFDQGKYLKSQEVPQKCENALYHFLAAYQIYKEHNEDLDLDEDKIFGSVLSDTNNEDLSEVYQIVKTTKSEAKVIDREKADNIVELFFKAFNDIILMFSDDLKYDQSLDIRSKNLTVEDKKRFREIRSILFKERDYETAITKAQSYFEPKMRKFIAKVLKNEYGDDWPEKLPIWLKESMSKRIRYERSTNADFVESTNKLEYCDFSDLIKIIKTFWDACFKNVFGITNFENLRVKWTEINTVRINWAHVRISSSTNPHNQVLKMLMNMIDVLKWTNKI